MRKHRSPKLTEYLSTFAILNAIGVHDTVLIEKRCSSVGIGIYVRDACDANTTVLVVPAHMICSNSVLSKLGTKVVLPRTDSSLERVQKLDDGLISFLSGLEKGRGWMECAWRLALERHRSYSRWWGWIQSLPSEKELRLLEEGIAGSCRALNPGLYSLFQKGRAKIKDEIKIAFELLSHSNLHPPFSSFSWAVEILLSRGMLLPCCWANKGNYEEPIVEYGIVPYVDLINGTCNDALKANAVVEVAEFQENLPDWYLSSLRDVENPIRNSLLDRVNVFQQHFCICVSLIRPLQASEEVVISYNTPLLTTGSLRESEEALLSRMLKYSF